jgi:transcriptional regulator with XRE-family HTH domain
MDKEIGTTLKEMRVMRSLTQTELGKVLNVSFQQIQKYKTGQNRIAAISLFKLLKYMNIPVVDFVKELEEARETTLRGRNEPTS